MVAAKSWPPHAWGRNDSMRPPRSCGRERGIAQLRRHTQAPHPIYERSENIGGQG